MFSFNPTAGEGGRMIMVGSFMLYHTNRTVLIVLLWVWKTKEKAEGIYPHGHFNRLHVYVAGQPLCMAPGLSQISKVRMEFDGGGKTVVIMVSIIYIQTLGSVDVAI